MTPRRGRIMYSDCPDIEEDYCGRTSLLVVTPKGTHYEHPFYIFTKDEFEAELKEAFEAGFESCKSIEPDSFEVWRERQLRDSANTRKV